MTDYIKEAITQFGEAINCAAATPATKDVMHVPSSDKSLLQKRKKFSQYSAKITIRVDYIPFRHLSCDCIPHDQSAQSMQQ